MASAHDPDSHASPLSDDEADACFSCLADINSVALGVSGGPDSLALLYLFNEWKIRSGWAGRSLVITVDHQLRPESSDEAEEVARHCAMLGLALETLAWTDPKPASNLQAAARDARYRLIAEALQEMQIDCLVLAHHQDDQAETFLDRLSRGSGVYGLGAMARDTSSGPHGLRLVRPLLDVPKMRLLAELLKRGLTWADDPSNYNTDYKRVRLRAIAEHLSSEGLDAGRLSGTAARLRRAAEAIDVWVGRFWDENVVEHPAGPLKLDFHSYEDLPEEVRLRLLSRLIMRATGRAMPLRLSQLEHVAGLIAGKEAQSTIAGAVVFRRDEQVFVWREAGRTPPPSWGLPLKSSAIWDGRFLVEANHGRPGLTGSETFLGPLISAPVKPGKADWPHDWPKACFSCAPAIWRGDDLVYVPGFSPNSEEDEGLPVKIRLLPMGLPIG